MLGQQQKLQVVQLLELNFTQGHLRVLSRQDADKVQREQDRHQRRHPEVLQHLTPGPLPLQVSYGTLAAKHATR